MNNKLLSYVDSVFKDFSPIKLKIISPILRQVIPFNRPHKISIKSMEENKCIAYMPKRRSNQNHLGGMHACAIATLGEFCAGICLIKNFSIVKFRPILKNLEIEYLYQGKTDLTGECFLTEKEIQEIHSNLSAESVSFVEMNSSIYDSAQNLVAKVKSTWQIKTWKAVKTKLS